MINRLTDSQPVPKRLPEPDENVYDSALWMLREIVREQDGDLTFREWIPDLTGAFLARWSNWCVFLWIHGVCVPPLARAEAAEAWQRTERNIWLGVRVGTRLIGELCKAGLSQAVTIERSEKGRIWNELDELPEEFSQTAVTKVRERFAERVSAVLALLPQRPISSREPTELHECVCALRKEAPFTMVAAWRFVVEMRRCRRWHDVGIEEELERLSHDASGRLHTWWEGMIWIASLLWIHCGPMIQAQARMEGKIERKQAERNSKVHLLRLQTMLDDEAAAVSTFRLQAGY